MLRVMDVMHYPINNAAEAQPAKHLLSLAFPVLFGYTEMAEILLQFVEREQVPDSDVQFRS